MRVCRLVAFMVWSLIFVSGLASEVAGGAEEKKEAQKPIVIKSKTLEINDSKKVVTFQGEVNATHPDFVMDCHQMQVHYEGSPTSTSGRQSEGGIDKIVATGHVVISRTQGGMATAEKAEYFHKEEKILLTGKPVVSQGKDVVEGDKITIYLKDNRSVVESVDSQRVKATIFPKGEMNKR